MIGRAFATTSPGPAGARSLPVDDYVPGVCNIGPAEIARRRRTGIVMSIVTVVLIAVLVLVHAPVLVRLIAFVPAAVAASGFIQAQLRFCAGFGWLGVFNFRDVGTTQTVASAEARHRDRQMAARIGVASALVGIVVVAIGALLPA